MGKPDNPLPRCRWTLRLYHHSKDTFEKGSRSSWHRWPYFSCVCIFPEQAELLEAVKMSSSDYSYDEQVRLPCAGFFALPKSFGHLSRFALAGWAGAVGAGMMMLTTMFLDRLGPVLPFLHLDRHRPGHPPFDIQSFPPKHRRRCACAAHLVRLQNKACRCRSVAAQGAEEEAEED